MFSIGTDFSIMTNSKQKINSKQRSRGQSRYIIKFEQNSAKQLLQSPPNSTKEQLTTRGISPSPLDSTQNISTPTKQQQQQQQHSTQSTSRGTWLERDAMGRRSKNPPSNKRKKYMRRLSKRSQARQTSSQREIKYSQHSHEDFQTDESMEGEYFAKLIRVY